MASSSPGGGVPNFLASGVAMTSKLSVSQMHLVNRKKKAIRVILQAKLPKRRELKKRHQRKMTTRKSKMQERSQLRSRM
jgi:hypothetical protein